jgi:hypothetical protein
MTNIFDSGHNQSERPSDPMLSRGHILTVPKQSFLVGQSRPIRYRISSRNPVCLREHFLSSFVILVPKHRDQISFWIYTSARWCIDSCKEQMGFQQTFVLLSFVSTSRNLRTTVRHLNTPLKSTNGGLYIPDRDVSHVPTFRKFSVTIRTAECNKHLPSYTLGVGLTGIVDSPSMSFILRCSFLHAPNWI